MSATAVSLVAGGNGTLYLSASLSAGQEYFTPLVLPTPASGTASAQIVATAGTPLASTPLSVTVSINNSSFAPAQAAINLPIVTISTNNVPIADKTTDVPGTITITSADGQTAYLPNSGDSDNSATFHLHGNTTTAMPKLSYHIKLNTSLDLLNTMGLSCPYVTSKGKPVCDKSKSYILLANFDDKSLLRDWSASALANAIPMGGDYLSSAAGSPSPSGNATLMPWAPHSLFVELYLNGVYEGNYQLIEQIKADSHRVNISELTESDVTDDITGGYLLEIDQHEAESSVFTTPQKVPIGLVDPDFSPDPEIPQQTSYISNYVDTAENALFADNYTDPTLGWRAYFDEASAINFYIVNDVMGNIDGGDFYSSDYLYKAIDNPLIYMGPVWDFDISAGNVNYALIGDPTVPWMQTANPWYPRWFSDAGFKADTVKQWNALKNNGVFASWLASIGQQAQTLEQSQANNFTRWPTLGIRVWPNTEAAGAYDSEVQFFTEWLQVRIAYLDSIFNKKKQTTTTLTAPASLQRVGVPVNLSAQVSGGTSPTGQVTFLANGIVLGTVALNGSSAGLSASLPGGTDSLEALYQGDQTNALSASAPQSISVLPATEQATISLGGPVSSLQGTKAQFTALAIPNQGTTVPSGNISFTVDGGTATIAPLNGGGAATYSSSSLAAGAHTISASYSGDSYFGAATGSFSFMVTPASTFSVSGSNVTLTAGATTGNTSTVTITPANGFTGQVTLSAAITSSPSGATDVPTLSFGTTSPVTISGATAESATLTISTTAATSAAVQGPAQGGSTWGGRSSLAFAGLLLVGLSARRRRWQSLVGMLGVLLILVAGVSSCAGGGSSGGSTNSGTTAGSYVVTVTGTSGSMTQTDTVSILVR